MKQEIHSQFIKIQLIIVVVNQIYYYLLFIISSYYFVLRGCLSALRDLQSLLTSQLSQTITVFLSFTIVSFNPIQDLSFCFGLLFSQRCLVDSVRGCSINHTCAYHCATARCHSYLLHYPIPPPAAPCSTLQHLPTPCSTLHHIAAPAFAAHYGVKLAPPITTNVVHCLNGTITKWRLISMLSS